MVREGCRMNYLRIIIEIIVALLPVLEKWAGKKYSLMQSNNR
jgi:hypothetical protein